MTKFYRFLLVVIISMFAIGCNNEQAMVLFNKHPINQETINSPANTNIFKPGERIYYLITLPKPVETKSLLIQIVKIGGGISEHGGYDLVWGKRVKLKDEQIYYFTDYIVLNQTGAYTMKVYSRDNPTKILTDGNFFVKE